MWKKFGICSIRKIVLVRKDRAFYKTLYQGVFFSIEGGRFLKNVHNVLGILLKKILKIINGRFYENFYSKNCRMLPVFDKLFGYFFGKENILYIFLKL